MPSTFGRLQHAEAATVLALDLSRSLEQRNYFEPARALVGRIERLLRDQRPNFPLHSLGFALHPWKFDEEELGQLREGTLVPENLEERKLRYGGKYDGGSNIQGVCAFGRLLLEESECVARQIIIFTDGEPTAHYVNGEVLYNWPPSQRCLLATLAEADACARQGVIIKIVMLSDEPELVQFMKELAQINGGQALFPDPKRLTEELAEVSDEELLKWVTDVPKIVY